MKKLKKIDWMDVFELADLGMELAFLETEVLLVILVSLLLICFYKK